MPRIGFSWCTSSHAATKKRQANLPQLRPPATGTNSASLGIYSFNLCDTLINSS